MDSNPSPPRSKAQESDANGHSNSSNPVKVGQSRKGDLTIPAAYSKHIVFSHFRMNISTYTLAMGCILKTHISRPFLIHFRCDWAHFEGLDALFPTMCNYVSTVLVMKGLKIIYMFTATSSTYNFII